MLVLFATIQSTKVALASQMSTHPPICAKGTEIACSESFHLKGEPHRCRTPEEELEKLQLMNVALAQWWTDATPPLLVILSVSTEPALELLTLHSTSCKVRPTPKRYIMPPSS